MSISRQTTSTALISFAGDSYLSKEYIQKFLPKSKKVEKVKRVKPKQKKKTQTLHKKKSKPKSKEFIQWYNYHIKEIDEHMRNILDICTHPELSFVNNTNVIYTKFIQILYKYFNKICDPRFIKVNVCSIDGNADPMQIELEIFNSLLDYYLDKRDYCELFQRININVLTSFVNSQLFYNAKVEYYSDEEMDY